MIDLDRIEALNRGEPSTASRTLVPALVAELRAARAEIERLREQYATLDAAATALDCAPCEVATVAARLRERLTRAEQRTDADERADVDRLRAAVLRVLAADNAGRGMVRALGELRAAWAAVEGAHVGAAKGAT